MRHRDAIPAGVAVVAPEPATVEACLDKFGIYEIVAELGISHVPFLRVSGYVELERAIDRLGYPCVVKPNDSRTGMFGMKAAILQTTADFKKRLPAWPEGNEFLILQRFATGYRHNCHFLAHEGRMLAYFEQRVLRTDRRDGTGYGVHGISHAPSPRLVEYSERLLRRLDYSGIGCAQFLVDDASGAVNFLEINPRLDATCAVPFYCGYDFPLLGVLYAEYRRGALPQPPTNTAAYPTDKHGVSLYRDIHGWRGALGRAELDRKGSRAWLKQMLRTFVRADFHLTWSWVDPMPACCRYLELLTSALARRAGASVSVPRSDYRVGGFQAPPSISPQYWRSG